MHYNYNYISIETDLDVIKIDVYSRLVFMMNRFSYFNLRCKGNLDPSRLWTDVYVNSNSAKRFVCLLLDSHLDCKTNTKQKASVPSEDNEIQV